MADKYVQYEKIRYNQVYQKGSHNSYWRYEGIYDQVLYWKIRSLEFDVHPDSSKTNVGEWAIYHEGFLISTVSSYQSHVANLNGVVEICRGINNVLPDHEVITIFLEIVEDISTFTADMATIFDAFMSANLGTVLYKPADLLAVSNSTMLKAAAQSNWPLLSDMRGKFVFVLCRSGRSTYCGTSGQLANGRACFFADQVSKAEDVGRYDYIAFYNIAWSDRVIGSTVNYNKFVGRVYPEIITNKDPEEPHIALSKQYEWAEAKKNEIHIISTNQVDSLKDPWARTDNISGFPFEGMYININPELAESGAVLGHGINSGDIGGEKDSFFFQYKEASGQAGSYTYYIGCPYHNTAKGAKCGIMARATIDANSPYFGVFRVAKGRIQVQYRTKTGGSTSTTQVSADSLVPDDSIWVSDCVFVKLEITADRKQVTAWASVEGGNNWVQIDQRSFSDALNLEGIASASYGNQSVRFIIGGPKNDGSLSAFGQPALIGEGINIGMHFPFYPPSRQIAAVVSQSSKMDDQKHRSSGNFNIQIVPERTIMVNWRVEQNNSSYPVGFDVYDDNSGGQTDNTVFYGLSAGARTAGNSERSLYIANPVFADGSNFLVVADAIGYFDESPVHAIPGYPLIASVMSYYKHQDSEDNRSSGNFSCQNLPSGTIAYAWTISENSDYEKIKFDVMEDESGKGDKKPFSDITHLQVTTTYTDRNLYIANPENIDNQDPFLVSVYAINSLPSNAPQVGSVESHCDPLKHEKHRSSEDFSTDSADTDSIKLYWVIEGVNADKIEFDVKKNNDKGGIDDLIFSGLKNGTWTEVKRSSHLYIADPKNATEDFTVKVYELPKTFPI